MADTCSNGGNAMLEHQHVQSYENSSSLEVNVDNEAFDSNELNSLMLETSQMYERVSKQISQNNDHGANKEYKTQVLTRVTRHQILIFSCTNVTINNHYFNEYNYGDNRNFL